MPRESLSFGDRSSGDRRRTDRRTRRLCIVAHERRSGFDRRSRGRGGGIITTADSVFAAIRDQPSAMRFMLVAINVLNLCDFGLTLNVIAEGGGEANPLMATLFAAGPLYAALFKFTAILLTTWLLWRCRRFKRAIQAGLLMTGVFAAVFAYHIVGLLVFL